MRDRRAKYGHESVAGKGRHAALIPVDSLHHAIHTSLHDLVDLLFAERFGKRREANRVREKDGYCTALAFQVSTLTQYLFRKVTRRVRTGGYLRAGGDSNCHRQTLATSRAENAMRRARAPARRARSYYFSSALSAKASVIRVIVLASYARCQDRLLSTCVWLSSTRPLST